MRILNRKCWPLLLVTLLSSSVAYASDGGTSFNAGDTAWVLISAALVFLMTPGLAFFYGGMVRSKNVLTTIMQSFFIAALVSVEFLLVGYTLAFSGDIHGLIGDLQKFGLDSVGSVLLSNGSIPELAFVAFQCMFAVITPALITGAFAERVRFAPFALFMALWSLFVYVPMAHWVWGGGFLANLGALDFAGGLVIHILSGVSGLTLALLLGKREGYGRIPMLPHHLPMTVLGAALLWFGWFGFNAGSALGATALAANAFITTQMAASAAALAWVFAEWFTNGKPTLLGAVSGVVAGLVSITPAAGFVTPLAALPIGIFGGLACYLAVAVVKGKLGYDDSLDAFGVHGIGGMWGSIATGLWATTAVNPDGTDGLFYGAHELLLAQVISIIVAILLAVAGSYIIYRIVNAIMPMRATLEAEIHGLDVEEHGERGYAQAFMSIGPAPLDKDGHPLPLGKE